MDTGNSRKRHNTKKNGVLGHFDLPEGRSPKEEEEEEEEEEDIISE